MSETHIKQILFFTINIMRNSFKKIDLRLNSVVLVIVEATIWTHCLQLPMPFFQFWFILYHISGLQTYYLSSTTSDGTDDYCEQLGWKRLQEYNPTQRCWKYLSTLAEGKALQDDNPFEDELEEEDYYPSLPFAALFSCLKVFFVQVWLWQLNIIFKLYFWHKKEKRVGVGGEGDLHVMLYGHLSTPNIF